MRTLLSLSIIILLLVVASCNRHHDPDPKPQAKVTDDGVRLMKMASGAVTWYFEYNIDGNVSKITFWDSSTTGPIITGAKTEFDYEYGTDHLVHKETVTKGHMVEVGMYTYDGLQHLQRVDITVIIDSPASTFTRYITYEWHNGKIVHVNSGNGYNSYCNYDVTGNPSGIVITSPSTISKDSISFDKMHSPVSSIKGLANAFNVYIDELAFLSFNNVLGCTESYSGYTQKRIYTYQYNSYGYPVKQIEAGGNFTWIYDYNK